MTMRMLDKGDSSRAALRHGRVKYEGSEVRRSSRLVRVLLLVLVTVGLVAPSASAAPSGGLGDTLGDMWTEVLETPTPVNPFAGGSTCVRFGGHIVAPFGPQGSESCTVSRADEVFSAAWTTECSTWEVPQPSTEADLRACARSADAGVTLVTIAVDGQPVPVTEVETGLLRIRLPGNNIFGVKDADRDGQSVAHGWVALLDPLPAGTHTIHVVVQGSPSADVTTSIIVH